MTAFRSKDEIGDKKKRTPDSMLFNNSPKQLLDVSVTLASANLYTALRVPSVSVIKWQISALLML